MAKNNTALWCGRAVVVLWAICSVWSALMGNGVSGQAAAGMAFLALIIFTGLHACQTVGWRQAGLFFGTVYLASFALEAVSIATGFPFGFFTHHTAMGPKPWGVPLVVPLGYAVFGWLAWSQARLIAQACCGQARYMAPVIGAFILAGYDYPYDAIGATVLKIHSYRYPSGLFGVPLSNFLGWLLTGWVAFQCVEWLKGIIRPVAREEQAGWHILPSLIWLGMAAGYWLQYLHAPIGKVATGSRVFVMADIYEAAAAISLPAMVFPALLSLMVAYRPGRH